MNFKRVAFIFDDGPNEDNTPVFLAAFARVGGHATFSHIGRNVAAKPGLARVAFQAGHEIMNHTYTHPHMRELTDEQSSRKSSELNGPSPTRPGQRHAAFWIPYGEYDERVLRAIAASGTPNFSLYGFNFVSTDDWNETLATEVHIYRKATERIVDKTIVLAHEWPKNTVAQINRILDTLKANGCEFLNLAEFGLTRPQPSESSTCRRPVRKRRARPLCHPSPHRRRRQCPRSD